MESVLGKGDGQVGKRPPAVFFARQAQHPPPAGFICSNSAVAVPLIPPPPSSRLRFPSASSKCSNINPSTSNNNIIIITSSTSTITIGNKTQQYFTLSWWREPWQRRQGPRGHNQDARDQSARSTPGQLPPWSLAEPWRRAEEDLHESAVRTLQTMEARPTRRNSDQVAIAVLASRKEGRGLRPSRMRPMASPYGVKEAPAFRRARPSWRKSVRSVSPVTLVQFWEMGVTFLL